MFLQDYQLDELKFAWCYRVYYRWRTYRASREAALAALDRATLDALLQPYDVHVLEATASESDVKVLASLLPTETVAVCAGKAKGRVSKWLREKLGLRQPRQFLARGYFACTAGPSAAESVAHYLDGQSEHHGYAERISPPVFVQRYPLTAADEPRLSAQHSATILRHHLVLATWKRKGVFGRREASAVAACWREQQDGLAIAIEKVSFVPDHVHVAVRLHPSLSPAAVALALMNAAQRRMWSDFPDAVIQAGVERLWQPSAYVGSFGDLESTKIAAYVKRWEAGSDEREAPPGKPGASGEAGRGPE